VNILIRFFELAFAADKRHALLRLRAEASMHRVQQAAVEAEKARLDLMDYEREVESVERARRDCL